MMMTRLARQTGLAFTIACSITIIVGCSGGSTSPTPQTGPAVTVETPAPASPWFEDAAASSGIDFVHDSGQAGEFLFPECVCGGAALFDMDLDGDLDAYLVQSGPVVRDADTTDIPRNKLYRNLGDGRFEDATEGSGADDDGYGIGVATGDIDNDGDLDLYVTNLGPNVLLRNDGDGRFTDVSASSGTDDERWGVSAAFLDYDGDGHLDLFVTNYIDWSLDNERSCYSFGQPDYCEPVGYQAPARDSLYRNNGDGTFDDVSEIAGLTTAFGNGMGVVCGDYNGDGHIDVFVANDQMHNQLWINQGDGHFVDEAMEAGVAVDREGHTKAGMGVSSEDIDDDGDLDLLVVNLDGQSDSVFVNDGAYFTDRTTSVGLGIVSRPFTRFGVGWRDLDNDGHLDLFEANGRVRRSADNWSDDVYAEPNVLCRGLPNGKFEEVQPRGGVTEPLIATSRAAAFGDVDNDGRLDILICNRDGAAHLLKNVTSDGHWIRFRVLDAHGRDAIGAVVTVSINGRSIRRDVRTGDSYCAAGDVRAHFGLGDHHAPVTATVRWPDGETATIPDCAVDRDHVVRYRQD